MAGLVQIGSGGGGTPQGRVIGIDLGTTNSLVAIHDGAEVHVIPDDDGRMLCPSVVYYPQEVKAAPVVGYDAIARGLDDPDGVIYSIKRFMGRGLAEAEGELKFRPYSVLTDSTEVVRIEVNGRIVTPPEVSAEILKTLKARAEKNLGETITKAVVTVPAYFNDSQRQATKDAGKLAGLDVLRIVNEPTAAALAYGLHTQAKGAVAVYDLGGGTFDISILKLSEGVFEVLATNGDTHLGGDDFDMALAAIVLHDIHETLGWDYRDNQRVIELARRAAERAKIALTDAASTTVSVAIPDAEKPFTREVTREEFTAAITPLVEQTLAPCRMAMEDAGLENADLDSVVMVGGSTRVPMVRDRVGALFQRELHTSLDPEEVVARGASVQAAILAGVVTDMLLLDLTPLSLGIETYGGAMAKLIERNSTIPVTATDSFTTFADGQTSVDIHVLQGDREMAEDNRSLARFKLSGVPPMPAGLPRIEVTFTIDADGILKVTATELRTDTEAHITVKPTYGLTDEEVEHMLRDSVEHAEEDFQKRLTADARAEAETMLHFLAKELVKHGDAVTAEERARIDEEAARLKEILPSGSHNDIRDQMARVDAATRPMAEKIMDESVRDALRSKSLDDVMSAGGRGSMAKS